MAVGALAAERCKCLFAVDSFYSTTLQIVISTVEYVARLREFVQVSGHCILDKIVGCATGFSGEFLNAGFGFRSEVNFHKLSLEKFELESKTVLRIRRWG